jgi:HK97 family phage prohead protease
MSKIEERRFVSAQVRTDTGSQRKTLTGIAARFNTLSEDLGGFRERLARGCFRASLASGKDVAMLADHDSGRILARKSNGTLRLRESDDGLLFDADLNTDTTIGADTWEMCRSGLWTEMSFGFFADDEDWSDELLLGDSRKTAIRTVKQASLIEISCVSFPAYSGGATSVMAAARSLFPAGGIPLELRSRGFTEDPAEAELLRRARVFLSSALLD